MALKGYSKAMNGMQTPVRAKGCWLATSGMIAQATSGVVEKVEDVCCEVVWVLHSSLALSGEQFPGLLFNSPLP